MSVFKDDMEKEYVVNSLLRKNRYDDLGNFIVMTGEVTSEDIFEYSEVSDNKFYINLFRHVSDFLFTQLKQDRFIEFAGNVLPNIYLDNFIDCKTIRTSQYKNRDVILSVFLKDMVSYLVENAYTKELSFVINSISDSDWIDKSVVKGILQSDIKFNNSFIIEDILGSGVLPLEDVIDLIEMRFEFTTDEDVLNLFRDLYTTEENLIDILEIVKSKFYFDKRKNGTIKVKPRTTGKTKRFYNLVRGFLTETIISEAEIDLWDYVNAAQADYMSSSDLYLLDIFTKIKEFLNSDDRKEFMVLMFNAHGQEEFKNTLSYDEVVDLNKEVHTVCYVYDLEILSAFKFFIRLFNINRFGFLSYDRAVSEIRRFVKERVYDVGPEVISSAVDEDTYNLLVNYE